MEGGFTPDALVDMSGGVEEKFSLKELFKSKTNCEIDKFWAILLRARKKKSVICCNLEPDSTVNELELDNGLIRGHAYVVTTLVTIPMENNKKHRILKCHKYYSLPFTPYERLY